MSNVYDCPNMVSDYQTDCLLHGLRLELKDDIDELKYGWWMYKKHKEATPERFNEIWGKGFSVYGLLDEYNQKSEDNIYDNILNKKYDKIIIGIHHTFNGMHAEWLSTINSLINYGYTKEQIVVIDGWDREDVCLEAIDKTTYYKREHNGKHKALPISFAIPEEKIISDTEQYDKIYDFSPMIPAMFCWDGNPHIESYVYTTEKSYYDQYKASYFAYTCKKAGWDCMRHYEILANGCIPWFTDIEACPSTIMTNFPKQLCVNAKKIKGVIPGTTVDYDPQKNTFLGDTRLIKPKEDRGYFLNGCESKEYVDLRQELLEYTRQHLTTRTLAKYILQ